MKQGEAWQRELAGMTAVAEAGVLDVASVIAVVQDATFETEE